MRFRKSVKGETVHELRQICRICALAAEFLYMAQYVIFYDKSLCNYIKCSIYVNFVKVYEFSPLVKIMIILHYCYILLRQNRNASRRR